MLSSFIHSYYIGDDPDHHRNHSDYVGFDIQFFSVFLTMLLLLNSYVRIAKDQIIAASNSQKTTDLDKENRENNKKGQR